MSDDDDLKALKQELKNAQSSEEDVSPNTTDPRTCPVCGKSFSSETGTKRHMTMTHGIASASPSGDKAPKRRKRAGKDLTPPLTDLFTSMGTITMMFDHFDGTVIVAGAPELAESLNRLAADNPKVRRALEGMVQGSSTGSLIVAVAAIVFPIAQNHGLFPLFPGQVPGSGQAPPKPESSASPSPGEGADDPWDVPLADDTESVII